MSAQGWERVRAKRKFKGEIDANSIAIGPIVSYLGGEVKEGKNVSVRCCLHSDSRRSAVINTYDNIYFCHTCGKGGNGVNLLMIVEGLEFKDALKRAVEIDATGGNSLRGSSRRSNAKVSRRSWNI